MTALAASALVAVSGASFKGEKIHAPAKAEKQVIANAHKKPDAIPYRELLATVFAYGRRAHDDLDLSEPGEAASFEQKAIDVHRLKHKRDIDRDTGPCLGLGLRLDRLRGGRASTWLHFASGQHRSGQPANIS